MSQRALSSLGTSCLSLLLVSLLGGCGGPSYERTSVSDVSQGDLSATISLQSISMPVGAAVKAIIVPYDDDGERMPGEISSETPTIIDIAPGLAEHEYIFIARAVGTTTVRFVAGGGVVAISRAQVTPQ